MTRPYHQTDGGANLQVGWQGRSLTEEEVALLRTYEKEMKEQGRSARDSCGRGQTRASSRRSQTPISLITGKQSMHYRNGREAKNGDKVVSFGGYGSGPVNIIAVGILYDATPGNDYCNGNIASIIGGPVQAACLVDCLHLDDLAAILKEKGLDKRPAGK